MNPTVIFLWVYNSNLKKKSEFNLLLSKLTSKCILCTLFLTNIVEVRDIVCKKPIMFGPRRLFYKDDFKLKKKVSKFSPKNFSLQYI